MLISLSWNSCKKLQCLSCIATVVLFSVWHMYAILAKIFYFLHFRSWNIKCVSYLHTFYIFPQITEVKTSLSFIYVKSKEEILANPETNTFESHHYTTCKSILHMCKELESFKYFDRFLQFYQRIQINNRTWRWMKLNDVSCLFVCTGNDISFSSFSFSFSLCVDAMHCETNWFCVPNREYGWLMRQNLPPLVNIHNTHSIQTFANIRQTHIIRQWHLHDKSFSPMKRYLENSENNFLNKFHCVLGSHTHTHTHLYIYTPNAQPLCEYYEVSFER